MRKARDSKPLRNKPSSQETHDREDVCIVPLSGSISWQKASEENCGNAIYLFKTVKDRKLSVESHFEVLILPQQSTTQAH